MRAEQCVGAENSAVGGINCRGSRAIQVAKSLRFVGIFAMAQGLLIHWGEK
jgi:hypothetical protein